jgi:hypothetical protein
MKWNPISNVWTMGCIAGLLIAGGALKARADENDQFWLTGGVKYKMTDQVSLKVAEQIRFKDETFYYRHTDLGLGVKLTANWSAAGTFRLVEKKNKAGEWQRCTGYLLDATYVASGWGAELKSRMRLAVFDPQYDADCSTDIRPRFDLSPAKGCTAWKLKPYIADELMVSLDEGNLYRNRVIVGLNAMPHKHLSLNLFMMNEQTESGDKWSGNWNAGLAATLNF